MSLATVIDIARRLAEGRTTSLDLTGQCLARIGDPSGEGPRAFIRLFAEQARATAAAWDGMRRAGVPLPALAGIPISVKDLCDVRGSTTTAGSVVLKDAPPAQEDAPIVARLRAAGAVILGTTNMTEFALGGLGLNPHYGTPRNPFDRKAARIPGGSSSGAAVSVTDAMAVAAIGTDTAGSVRMPAALCGLAGFKPTARRVPLAGTLPLAPSLDSVGVLGATVACCAQVDGIIADEPFDIASVPLSRLRFAVATTLVLDDLEPAVADAFARVLTTLSAAGARVTEIGFRELGELPKINAQGGFAVAEGYAWHRALLDEKRALYDPIIGARFATGAGISAADYIELCNARARLIDAARPLTAAFDAVLMPSVPITAPRIADLEADESLYLATSRRLIRNPGVANFLDRCALTIPCHEPGSAPVGITLMGEAMADHRLLSIGRSVEAVLTHPH
ncbi:MAG: aspartyl-tRNA(Asn)/glutamyl-tRNA(Gln) amidotransferase subunit [Alphaproteobacteria bacterium]|jgi:aspartyl-tRNA(Asn)/glutamyl-tRNA(Gln) amidotransferase subunit A|nr:aspartyl-tRNA(Asn)/glutamyl-tRNA(Gln) amidotransferase subunit [Alphaproteobacteria bacterium]